MSQTSQVCDAQGCKSGTANLIQSGSVTTLTATAGTFRSSDHGHVLTITASNNPANRGNFTINYVNSTTVTFANASGVTEIGAGWNMYCPNEETILGCNGFDDDCDAVVDDCTDGVADSCCP